MAFAANPHCRKLCGAHAGAGQRAARRLSRHSDRIFIRPRDALGVHRYAALAVGPNTSNFPRGNAVAWDVNTIAYNAHRFTRTHHEFDLLHTSSIAKPRRAAILLLAPLPATFSYRHLE